MIKRIVFPVLLCAIIAGCQTSQVVDVGEPITKPVDGMATNVVDGMPEPDEPTTPATEPAVEVPVAATVTNAATEAAEVASVNAHEGMNEERNKIMILMKTSMGDITLELDKEKAPETVENFLSYLEAGHFNGTIFHRVIDGFMIQGGGFDASMNQKPAPRTVKNEANNGLRNVAGSIAMARTPNPHSASAQFFINVNDNKFLDYPGQDGWGYCVFGQVVDGMDVVDAIKEVPTRTVGPHQNVPVEPVVIESVAVIDPEG